MYCLYRIRAESLEPANPSWHGVRPRSHPGEVTSWSQGHTPKKNLDLISHCITITKVNIVKNWTIKRKKMRTDRSVECVDTLSFQLQSESSQCLCSPHHSVSFCRLVLFYIDSFWSQTFLSCDFYNKAVGCVTRCVYRQNSGSASTTG